MNKTDEDELRSTLWIELRTVLYDKMSVETAYCNDIEFNWDSYNRDKNKRRAKNNGYEYQLWKIKID